MSDAVSDDGTAEHRGAPSRRSGRDVDRAALLGAALTAVVALTFGGQGAWDWLASVTGVALVCVLVAFFRLQEHVGESRVELVAFAAVGALCLTLVLAAPLQVVVANSATGRDCDAAGALAAARLLGDEAATGHAAAAAGRLPAGTSPAAVLEAAAANEAADVSGVCLGAATNRVLWIPAVALGVVLSAAALTLRRRPAG